MNRFATVLIIVAGFVVSDLALPGVAKGRVMGQYDPTTGQIIVSATNIVLWYVEHVGFASMTGDAPSGLPAGGGLVSNDDWRIGEASLSQFSFTDLNLGNVAQTGIPDDGSLQIFWVFGLGMPINNLPLTFASGSINTPPQASINGPFVVDLLNDPLNITLDASGSTDDGILAPLTYRWDLDNDNIFEVDTGTNPVLEIADVSSTFGGHGIYNVDVKVSDGEFWDIAPTMVSLFSEPIVPATAQYDPATGQIVASVYGVSNWFVNSLSYGLTGYEPAGLPKAGGLVTNHDARIGETKTELFSYTVDLGYVAQTGLQEGDLTISWNGLRGTFHSLPVTYGSIASDPKGFVPEPTGLVLILVGALGLVYNRWGLH